MISVGQTVVKCFGHQNKTVHLPDSNNYSELISKNSLPRSVETTAFLLNVGNLLPTDKTILLIVMILKYEDKSVPSVR